MLTYAHGIYFFYVYFPYRIVEQWFAITQQFNQLWKPKIKIKNISHMETLKLFGGAHYRAFWFNAPFLLEYSEQFTVTVSCGFDFTSFPFDENECLFVFGEIKFEKHELVFGPMEVYVDEKSTTVDQAPILVGDTKLPFLIQITAMETRDWTTNFNETYSFSGIKIKFIRNSLGKLLSQFYFPTGMFACLSLISFLIDHKQVKHVQRAANNKVTQLCNMRIVKHCYFF